MGSLVAAAGTSIFRPFSGLELSVTWIFPPEAPIDCVVVCTFCPVCMVKWFCVVGVALAVGCADENGVLELEGNAVGEGLTSGLGSLNMPEKNKMGIKRTAIRITTIAAMSVRDFLGFGGGGGSGNCPLKRSLRTKFSLII